MSKERDIKEKKMKANFAHEALRYIVDDILDEQYADNQIPFPNLGVVGIVSDPETFKEFDEDTDIKLDVLFEIQYWGADMNEIDEDNIYIGPNSNKKTFQSFLDNINALKNFIQEKDFDKFAELYPLDNNHCPDYIFCEEPYFVYKNAIPCEDDYYHCLSKDTMSAELKEFVEHEERMFCENFKHTEDYKKWEENVKWFKENASQMQEAITEIISIKKNLALEHQQLQLDVFGDGTGPKTGPKPTIIKWP